MNAPSLAHLLPIRPLYLRVPRSGEHCPHTGLTRSMLLALVLPAQSNDFCPPVESFLRLKPGATKGIRLIVWASLENHIRSCGAGRQTHRPETRRSA